MPPRRRSRLVIEAALDLAELRRDVVDLRKRINLLSKQRKTIGATACKGVEFRREYVDLQRHIKLLLQRSDEIDAKCDAITAAVKDPFVCESTPPPALNECCWEPDFMKESSDCNGSLPTDCLDATSDTHCLFALDGLEADFAPNSGDPVFDDYVDDNNSFSNDLGVDYCDDECGIAPNAGEPIYDDYYDDDAELAPSLIDSIYDDDVAVKEVVEDCVAEHIDPVLLMRGIYVAPHTPVAKRLRKNIGKNIEFPLINAEYGVIYDDVTCDDVVLLDANNLLLPCVNWKRLKKRKHVLFDCELVFFYWCYGDIPHLDGNQDEVLGEASDSTRNSRTNFFCPGENDADKRLRFIGLVGPHYLVRVLFR